MTEWRILTPGMRCRLGEGPLPVACEDALYWVDLLAPALHRLSLTDGTVATWPMPGMIGFIVKRAQGGFVIGLPGGFAALTLEPFAITPLLDPEPYHPAHRMNDATVDAAGRLWAGTMLPDGGAPVGSLYRLDAALDCTVADTGYHIPNGPSFDTTGWFYHADSARRVIYRFRVEADGTLAQRAVHIAFERTDWGIPDGTTIDAEGCLWVAHWDGARLSRFDPTGQLMRQINLPVSRVTSCAFGGAANDRLFVTSAAHECEHEPLAGAVFEVDAGVVGVTHYAFAG